MIDLKKLLKSFCHKFYLNVFIKFINNEWRNLEEIAFNNVPASSRHRRHEFTVHNVIEYLDSLHSQF